MIVVECWYLYEFDVLCVLVIMCVDCYYLFVVIGDEVFDYCEMLVYYLGVKICVIDGSDYGISEFVDYVDDVFVFCDGKMF